MTTSRRVGCMTLAALMTASLALLSAPTAGAHTSTTAARALPDGNFRVVNEESEECLEVDDDGYVYMNWCDSGNDRQLWNSQGGASLRNVVTGHCLEDTQDGNVWGDDACRDGDAERWQYTDERWLQNWASGACLAHGNSVYVTTCGDWADERWQLKQ